MIEIIAAAALATQGVPCSDYEARRGFNLLSTTVERAILIGAPGFEHIAGRDSEVSIPDMSITRLGSCSWRGASTVTVEIGSREIEYAFYVEYTYIRYENLYDATKFVFNGETLVDV